MSLTSKYTGYCRNELKVHPILPFGLPLTVGTVGVIKKDQFVRRGTTESVLRVPAGETTRSGQPVDWSRLSGTGSEVGFLASGQASKLFPQAPAASAGAEVHLGAKGSFLASIREVEIETLTDPFDLLQTMVTGYQSGVWRKEYVLVTEVVRPREALVLVARSASTDVLLEASASVTPTQLADLAGNVHVTSMSQDVVRFEGGGLPLFFNAQRVKESFWTQIDSVVPFSDEVDPDAVFESA